MEKDSSPQDAGEAPKGGWEKGRTVEVVSSFGETVSENYQSKNFFCSLKETVPLSKFTSTYEELSKRCREAVQAEKEKFEASFERNLDFPIIEPIYEPPQKIKPF